MGIIYKQNIADACENFVKIFGANKNLYRIMVSMQDGLKPVHRRFLFSLWRGRGRNNFIKMSKAAADTTADFHPHGNASVEDVGAKLTSTIINNVPCVEGQGNFGSYKNDRPGASRYIECKLSKYAKKCFFEDYENSNVDMREAYTGIEDEPEVLPARYPHALFNPSISGIGYGLASNIPPFNVTEVMEATIKLIKNPNAKIYLVPDSPTGADIIDDGQFEKINSDGVGTFTLRGSTEVDEINNTITITSIPLQTTIDKIIKKIVDLREKKMFDEIKEIKDYTKNKDGVRTVIYLEPTANPYKTVEKLYTKKTDLTKTYPVGMKMVDDFKDIDYGVKSFLLEWIEYRRDTVRSSFNTQLVRAMEQQNINDILLKIVNSENSEATIKLAKESIDSADFAQKLMKKYKMDSQQANTISNMKIQAFTKGAYKTYKARKAELIEEINRLENVLDNDSEIDDIIIAQLKEGIKLFGRPRLSKVVSAITEDDVPDSEHIVGISKDGYVKKVSSSEGKIGQVGQTNSQYMTMKVNNKSNLLIFDSTGMVSKIPVSSIPDMEIDTVGVLLERYFSVNGNIVSTLIEPTKQELKKMGKDLYIIFLTKSGYVKKTLLSEFANTNGSTRAIKLPLMDELVATEFASDNTVKDLVIYTNLGNGIRRDINEFSVMKANARGVSQLTLGEGEYCVGCDKITPDKKYMFYITSSGRAKLTDMKYFPTMKRKNETLSLINLDNKDTLVGIKGVVKTNDVVVYRKNSGPEVIHISDMPVSTRIAKAEKYVKTPKGDKVIAYTIINK